MKKYRTIVILLLMIVIALFVFPIIIKFLMETPAPFEFMKIVTKDTYEAWIGYYGAIVGGALTLVGVWWTIKFESENLREQAEIEKMTKYFPTISARVLKNSSVNDLCSCVNIKINNDLFNQDVEEQGDCLIGLGNIGQTEVLMDGIILDSFILSNVNEQLNVLRSELNDELIGDGNFKFLPPGESFYLKIGFSKLKEYERDLTKCTEGTRLFTVAYSFILNIGGVLTGDDSFQYFLTFDVDVYMKESTSYAYKIYNVSLVR